MLFQRDFNNMLKIYFTVILTFILLICVFFIPLADSFDILPFSQSGTFNELTAQQSIENSNYSQKNSQVISFNNIGWPLPGYTTISSPFGYRGIPTAGATSFHGGVDLPAPAGTNIISAISGKVTHTGFMGSGGCTVVVENEKYTVIFHHISPSYLVHPGDYVEQGQVIAQVGPKNVYGFSNNPYTDINRKSY